MAEALGAISAVAGLMSNVVTAIQQIETARERVHGKSRIINHASTQLDTTYQSLILVRDERTLQTASVQQQCTEIVKIADDLHAYFDRLSAEKQRSHTRQFFSALRSGGKDEEELAGILKRMDRARMELVFRITLAEAGLMGDVKDGFNVMADILMSTNQKCKDTLGAELKLAGQLKGRQPGPDGKLPLANGELHNLGLAKPPKTVDAPPKLDINFCDNLTLDQASIMMGSAGVQNWEFTAGMRVNISGNRFGNSLKLFVGDLNGVTPIQQAKQVEQVMA